MDFDRTYSRDPGLWRQFMSYAVGRGHQVVIVTCRTDRPDNRELLRKEFASREALKFITDIVFTEHRPKRREAEARGYQIDIWIDDVPEVIGAADTHAVRKIEERFNIPVT